MISLKLFKSIIGHIKQQEEKDEKLTKLLMDQDFNGWISTANDLIDDLIKLLEYELGDKYETISWWLYDIGDGDKYVYEDFRDNKQVEYDLNSLDDLYHYISGDLENVKQKVVFKEQTPEISKEEASTFKEVFNSIWVDEIDEL